MAEFDQQKAYAPQGDVFLDDGREVQLLHYVYSRHDVDELRGSPPKVLQAIDEYARTRKYLMNVGEHKGAIVAGLISETKPQVMVELGGYVGYSAILFGAALRAAGGRRYLSLERNPEFAAVAGSLVDLAGLADTVSVLVGPSAASLRRLRTHNAVDHIDLLFLDHYKPAYLPDLKLCEHLGLLRPGAVLAADNVVKPGNPPYLEYVRSSVDTKRAAVAASAGPAAVSDQAQLFTEWYARQYEKREGAEILDADVPGDPDLVYESRMVESFEPTGEPDGIEITRCVGRQS